MIPTLPSGKNVEKNVEKNLDPSARADRLLERIGLSDLRDALPSELSVGQAQRVAVARALINGPALLLADEPTGSLDHATAESLGDLLIQLHHQENMALLVVTHSTALAGRMQRVLRLRDGKLWPDGTAG